MDIWFKVKVNTVAMLISVVLIPIFVVGIVLWVVFAPPRLNEKIEEAKASVARRMPEFQDVSPSEIHFRRNNGADTPTFSVWAQNRTEIPVSDDILNNMLASAFVDSDSSNDIAIAIWFPVIMLVVGILICCMLHHLCRQSWKDLEPEYQQALLESAKRMTAKDMRRSGENY